MSLSSPAGLAVSDPKVASESALLSVLNFYSDEVHPDDLQIVADELASRGGDPDYVGTVDTFRLGVDF